MNDLYLIIIGFFFGLFTYSLCKGAVSFYRRILWNRETKRIRDHTHLRMAVGGEVLHGRTK